MSRTSCPHCGEPVAIYSRLDKYKRGPKDYGGRIDMTIAKAMRENGDSWLDVGLKFGVSGQAAREACKRRLIE